jgi:hypothetical protein
LDAQRAALTRPVKSSTGRVVRAEKSPAHRTAHGPVAFTAEPQPFDPGRRAALSARVIAAVGLVHRES